jgi:hypothetical protein
MFDWDEYESSTILMDAYEARTNLTEEYEEGKSLTGMSMKWVIFTFDRDKYQLGKCLTRSE